MCHQLALAAAFALAAGLCRADELKADWCDFRASINGEFDTGTNDPEFGFSTAHIKSEKYAADWLCERIATAPLPDEKELCRERETATEETEGKFVACFWNSGKDGQYVTAVTLSEYSGSHLSVEGRWVASGSTFTLLLADYGMTADERIALFKQFADGVTFIPSDAN